MDGDIIIRSTEEVSPQISWKHWTGAVVGNHHSSQPKASASFFLPSVSPLPVPPTGRYQQEPEKGSLQTPSHKWALCGKVGLSREDRRERNGTFCIMKASANQAVSAGADTCPQGRAPYLSDRSNIMKATPILYHFHPPKKVENKVHLPGNQCAKLKCWGSLYFKIHKEG